MSLQSVDQFVRVAAETACPFCGETKLCAFAIVDIVRGPNDYVHAVQCICGASGPRADTPALAWQAWEDRNTQVIEDFIQAKHKRDIADREARCSQSLEKRLADIPTSGIGGLVAKGRV